jgi:hypothetical protein
MASIVNLTLSALAVTLLENGVPIPEICRELSVGGPSFISGVDFLQMKLKLGSYINRIGFDFN